MSFWKSLFGGGSGKEAGLAKPVRIAEHNGFRIEATPYEEAGQFQVSGTISKDIDGALRQHKFVRADRFGSRDEAAEFSLMKARQIIEQGDVEEALNAASAIGDDTLQKRGRGQVVPESFTHGTSAQRVRWFRTGLTGGSVRQCNTFDAKEL